MNDYQRIAKSIEYITSHVSEQPTLDNVAKYLNLSPYHFQRLFTRWAGVSPKRFLQSLTVQHAKALLKETDSIIETSNRLGLSSTSRLNDHFVKLEAITPGEYKKNGEGLEINYGVHDTPFGSAFIAVTDRGICQLSFIDSGSDVSPVIELKRKWMLATINESKKQTKPIMNAIFSKDKKSTLSVYVQGTNFQINVWKALLEIPNGKLSTYGQIAKLIGNPNASRAVGTAIGANPVAFLIPCHRIIRSTAVIGEYRWGRIRKRGMLSWEAVSQSTKKNCKN